MTLTEAADRLGVSPSTLRVQLWKGKLKGTKRGRDWWITPAEVERYASEHGRKVNRCPIRDPWGAVARCELMTGHPGEHVNAVHARHWPELGEPEHPRCNNRSCVAGCRERKNR